MECQICLKEFDLTERRPKVLPCGHTSCLRCLKKLPESKCPVDRKDFTGPPENLKDNCQLISSVLRPQPKFWCHDCKKTASSKECMEWHSVCSVNKVHLEEAKSLLGKLSSAVNCVNTQMQTEDKLRELLAKRSLQSERWHKRLKVAHENLQQSVDKKSELTEQMGEASTALVEASTALAVETAETGLPPPFLLNSALAASSAASSTPTTSSLPKNDAFGFSNSAPGKTSSTSARPELVAATDTPSSTLPTSRSTHSPCTLSSSKSANATTASGSSVGGPPLSNAKM